MIKWRVVLEADAETGDWSVWCPELSGCVSVLTSGTRCDHTLGSDAIIYFVGT